VDNAMDACEEAGILPDITVAIEHLPEVDEGRYRVTVTDNGPGIVRKQVENIFGKLLYGSKFHRLKMSRGQQGIGISAAGMYGLMTTGKPMVITTRPRKNKPAHHLELAMDTTRNRPEVITDIETNEFIETSSGTGTSVAIELEARYTRGKTSVDAYLEQTAIANPHAQITFIPPGKNAGGTESSAKNATEQEGVTGGRASQVDDSDDTGTDSATCASASATSASSQRNAVPGRIVFPRTVQALPAEPREIKPHPYGVELGTFLRMLKSTREKQLGGFFKHEFCRITPGVAKEVYRAGGVTGQTWIKTIEPAAAQRLYKALQQAKLRSPPTDCLSPIGVRQMLSGMLKGVGAEFYAAATRQPAVYRGNPFQIEAAIAFGGDLPGDEPARVFRFANRVPLLYQQSSCCAFKSVVDTGWRTYGLSQPRGSLPVGPLVVMIHMASVWVPFTSESKEAIADYDQIKKEMRLAIQDCGRKLGTYLRRRQRMKRESQRRGVFERYIGEIARACSAITGTDADTLYEALIRQAQRRTEIADALLDEDGRFVKGNGRLDDDDGVIIVDPAPTPPPSPAPPESGLSTSPPERKQSRHPSRKKRATASNGPDRGTRAPRGRASGKPRIQIQLESAAPGLFEQGAAR